MAQARGMTRGLWLSARASAVWAAILLALFAGAHWVVFAFLPRLADDYWYQTYITLYPGWKGVWETIAYHYLHDNGRLSNVLFTLTLPLPRTIGALLPAAAVAWLVAEVWRFAGVRASRSFLGVTLAMLLVAAGLPWFEYFFTLCYAYNYIIPAAMGACFFRAVDSGRGSLSPRHALNALLLGFWNEAFAGPLLVACLVYGVMRRGAARRRALLAGALLLPGLVYIAVCLLQIFVRDGFPDYLKLTVPQIIRQFTKLQVPVFLFVAFWLWQALRAHGRARSRRLRSPLAWTVIAMLVVTIGMCIMQPRGERITTVATLIALMGLLRLVRRSVRGPWARNSGRATLTAFLVALLLGAHLAEVVRLTFALRRAWADVDRQALATDRIGPIFADLDGMTATSLLSWRKPMPLALDNWSVWAFQCYYAYTSGHGDDHFRRRLYVVPRSLLDVKPTDGVPVPGTAGVRRLGEWYFAPLREGVAPHMPGKAGPFRKTIYSYYAPFTARDGRRYAFLYPQRVFFPSFLLPVTEINLALPREAFPANFHMQMLDSIVDANGGHAEYPVMSDE